MRCVVMVVSHSHVRVRYRYRVCYSGMEKKEKREAAWEKKKKKKKKKRQRHGRQLTVLQRHVCAADLQVPAHVVRRDMGHGAARGDGDVVGRVDGRTAGNGQAAQSRGSTVGQGGLQKLESHGCCSCCRMSSVTVTVTARGPGHFWRGGRSMQGTLRSA